MAAAIGLLAFAAQAAAADFYAYYTRLDYTQPATPDWLAGIPVNAANVFSGGRPDPADAVPQPPAPGPVRWGKYADLVVNVGGAGRLVFSRATGYLPYLQTAKGRSPFRPLVECREDPLCLCSFVRLVEDLPSRIVVHWRHVPDPASVVMTEVVHEYFIITPDGRVRREVRTGTERLDDFNDPANVTVQELLLSPEGIVERSLTRAQALALARPGRCRRAAPRRRRRGAGRVAEVRRGARTQPRRDRRGGRRHAVVPSPATRRFGRKASPARPWPSTGISRRSPCRGTRRRRSRTS
ncbi:MAG: hypothetical protein M0C28_39950 [Candidatus Moduliflexus flocculans]|nr:hypothetical protein [Candidatus Moduliflexus flocculans]